MRTIAKVIPISRRFFNCLFDGLFMYLFTIGQPDIKH